MSTLALADYATTVLGIDASPEMLRSAVGAPRVTYMLASAERLPVAARTIDAVTCCSAVHWFDQERFFGELHRGLVPGGWVGLYDHYFLDMADVDEFKEWARVCFDRYPLPPRNPQVGDPRSETPNGFELVASDFFEDPIAMTQDQFVDYQLSVSNCVEAVERGTLRAEVRDWLMDSTAPLFAGVPTRTLQFLGSITCLRRDSAA
jgi:ubiquinone/menaquinone biosynthesis C-methylase UbiE